MNVSEQEGYGCELPAYYSQLHNVSCQYFTNDPTIFNYSGELMTMRKPLIDPLISISLKYCRTQDIWLIYNIVLADLHCELAKASHWESFLARRGEVWFLISTIGWSWQGTTDTSLVNCNETLASHWWRLPTHYNLLVIKIMNTEIQYYYSTAVCLSVSVF